MKHIEQLIDARRCGVPITIVKTTDPTSFIEQAKAAITDCAIIQHDISRGVLGCNELGEKAAKLINANKAGNPPAIATGNFTAAIRGAYDNLPKQGLMFMINADLALEGYGEQPKAAIQSAWNCRDEFKADGRTLALLCQDIKLPPQLANDVITIEVDLPTDQELKDLAVKTAKIASVELAPEMISRTVDAITGLPLFPAENILAMSLREDGYALEELWAHKRSIIQRVGGLTVETRRTSFDDLGGLENIKRYLRLIIRGKRRPRLVVLVDEADRQLSGINDSAGVGGDAYQQVLSNMQDNDWWGMLCPGFAGAGKTEIANAMGSEAGGLFIKLDLGGMQSSFVGDSQKLVRAAMRTLKAMGGREVFFVATTNNPAAIRPELKRRFSAGTFFFDLPTKEEQRPIWAIYRSRYEINEEPLQDEVCSGWTGAEIKKVCELSNILGIPLTDAANYITPVIRSMGDDVQKMRKQAHKKYLSASNPGWYQISEKVKPRDVVTALKAQSESQN